MKVYLNYTLPTNSLIFWFMKFSGVAFGLMAVTCAGAFFANLEEAKNALNVNLMQVLRCARLFFVPILIYALVNRTKF